jgi:acetyl esterase/lipase
MAVVVLLVACNNVGGERENSPGGNANQVSSIVQCRKGCEVNITRNIAFVTGAEAHVRHKLDIYAPQDVLNFPVLMFVSGGGWSSGSKDWIANVGTTFAVQGLGVVTVDHRLMPAVTYSQQVEDLARAFAWVKKNVNAYGGDPGRIVVGGHSAGGHLIALLAMDERYLKVVGRRSDDIMGMLFVSAALDVGDRFAASGDIAAASPINHVRAGLPSTLLLFAENDLPAIPAQAEAMKIALDSVGIPVERAMIANRDHFNIIHHIGAPDDVATETIYDWLVTVLDMDGD